MEWLVDLSIFLFIFTCGFVLFYILLIYNRMKYSEESITKVNKLSKDFTEAYHEWTKEKEQMIMLIKSQTDKINILTNENLLLKSRIEYLETNKNTMPQTPLLVICGDSVFCDADRLQLNRTKIWYRTLEKATKQNIIDELNRRRENEDLYIWVHVSAHGSKDGIEFEDGIATPQWFNEHFEGIKIAFFSNCESIYVGDFLSGVADYVIVFYGNRESKTLERFTYAFWNELNESQNVLASYKKSLAMVPEARQYVDIRVR